MPPAEHSKTVDFRIKLVLLMSAPCVSDVPVMDKLTDLKLNQLIVEEEEEPTNADQPKALSHMLLWIFKTFTFKVPDVTELQSMVPLYDTENLKWNWALPKCHHESGIIQLPSLEEGGDQGGGSSASDSEESGGEDLSSQLEDTSSKPHMLEDIFSSFFNTTCGAVAKMRRKEIIKENIGAVARTWSSQNSTCPVKDKEVLRKPDLVLLDDMEAQWDTIKAVCKLTSQLYTPTGMIGKTINSKAYLLFETPTLEAAESDLEMGSDMEMSLSLEESLPQDPPQLEMPEDPLHRSFSDPIGRITGLVGCSTVCYLARRDDEEYIIKDHWVLGGKDAVLNKVRMLWEMQGVHGAPELVEYWLVEIVPNEPRARPLHVFQTKLELVSALQDIVIVQHIVVEDCGVLHCDCSLNNAMIEDDDNGTNGLLINWEFTVHIDMGRKYTIGGTGMLPFMSRSLLRQLSEAVGDVATSARSWKAKLAVSSLTKPPPLILHHYHDDLKLLFYIFVCICIEYRGPLGVKCDLLADRSQEWLPHLWSADTFKAGSDVKTSFFFHPNADKLKKQFHPYFNTLIPLTTQWYDLIRNKGPSSAVTFGEVLNLLEMHLAELLFAKKFIMALPKKRHTSDLEGDGDRDKYINEPPNTERNLIHSRMGWTMEVAPQPKQSRTT
ncbi:hypothetical protein EDB19DRAFT_1917944 [Suillus lakei]|nr:hypothetical protein EDB19DRAFT_1917944 [Suillus lakei]